MANSFQSRAKPFIFYQEAAEAQVKLAKLERERKKKKGDGGGDKGHPAATVICNRALGNARRHYSNQANVYRDPDSVSAARMS